MAPIAGDANRRADWGSAGAAMTAWNNSHSETKPLSGGSAEAASAPIRKNTAVRGMRKRGVGFMPTPGTYYDALPERIREMGIAKIDEDLAVLRDLEILVDGDKGAYLLQIFLKESSGLYADPSAGPFFYEIIQRKGDQGFGAGNFRALFESIERQQSATAR